MAAESQPDWAQAIYVYFDKPERLHALWHLRKEIPLPTLRELFAGVWVNSESHYQDMGVIKQLFAYCKDGLGARQLWMMPADDKKAYNQLKMRRSSLTIYRGCWAENRDGWSWTVDREVAAKFAKRHAPDGWPLVVRGKIMFRDVIAYIDERNEKEIIIKPEHVFDKHVERLEFQKPEFNKMIFQAIQAGNFDRGNEVERMVLTARLDPARYLEFLRHQLAFFERYKFDVKVALFKEVEQRVLANLPTEQVHEHYSI